MMNARVPVMVALALVAMTLPASAGHGHPYMVHGSACADEPIGCWDATLDWGGGGRFRITLTDPDTGLSLVPIQFLGDEEFRDFLFVLGGPCGATEFFDYRATDRVTGGEHFEVTGDLSLCLNFDHVYHGTLRGHFLDFDLVLPFPVPEPAVP